MTLKRGPLSSDERAEIERLAGAASKPNIGKIARALNRHRGTIFWHLLRRGYLSRELGYNVKPYLRGGKLVRPFTADEDRHAVALRLDGLNARQIAEALKAEGFHDRTAHGGHSVAVRLEFLAAYRSSPEDAAE